MKNNRLTEHLKEKCWNQYYDPDRCSGRSTVIALRAIAQAISNPGQWVKPSDHYGTRQADRELLRLISHIVESMGLRYVTFAKGAFRCEHITD